MSKHNTFIQRWHPQFLVDLSLWYAAYRTDSITKDGSNFVSQWNDLSTNAYHVTQGTGSSQPLWNATGFGTNSRPYVQFDGGSDFLSLTVSNIFATHTVGTMIVIGAGVCGANQNSFISSCDTATARTFEHQYQNPSLTNNSLGIRVNEPAVGIRNSQGITYQTVSNTPFISICQSVGSGSNYVWRTNGASATQGNNTATLPSGIWWSHFPTQRDNLVLGGRRSTTNTFANVRIAEIIYTSSVLTTSQIQAVELYANTYYGIY